MVFFSAGKTAKVESFISIMLCEGVNSYFNSFLAGSSAFQNSCRSLMTGGMPPVQRKNGESG